MSSPLLAKLIINDLKTSVRVAQQSNDPSVFNVKPQQFVQQPVEPQCGILEVKEQEVIERHNEILEQDNVLERKEIKTAMSEPSTKTIGEIHEVPTEIELPIIEEATCCVCGVNCACVDKKFIIKPKQEKVVELDKFETQNSILMEDAI